MTWDWKKTIEGGDNSPPVLPANGPSRPQKHPRARGARQTDASPEIRRDAGIVLPSTGIQHAEARPGDPPMLLYGKEYDCAFCRGEGQWPKDSVCPVCRGTGKVCVPAPAVQCAFCRGHGQVPRRTTLTCCVCRGKGIVAVAPPVRICPDCGGRGKKRGQSLYCARCRGAGVVTSHQSSTPPAAGRGVSSNIRTECKLERKAS